LIVARFDYLFSLWLPVANGQIYGSSDK